MPELIKELQFYNYFTMDTPGPGPFGQRVIAKVTGGEFSGDRLTGSLVGAGGDWLLAGADGYGRIDVRGTFATHDGAFIYVQYHGLVELTPAIQAILGGSGEPTDYGDQYFFTTPRMETGDERYAWVNQSVFLGEGRLLPGLRVEYNVYRVVH